MPTPKTPVIVAAKSVTLGTGDRVVFRNITQGSKETVICNSSGEAVVDNPPASWTNGDVIIIETFGKYNASLQTTISKGGVKGQLGTLSEDTSADAINL